MADWLMRSSRDRSSSGCFWQPRWSWHKIRQGEFVELSGRKTAVKKSPTAQQKPSVSQSPGYRKSNTKEFEEGADCHSRFKREKVEGRQSPGLPAYPVNDTRKQGWRLTGVGVHRVGVDGQLILREMAKRKVSPANQCSRL
jgi:hypothetical protein